MNASFPYHKITIIIEGTDGSRTEVVAEKAIEHALSVKYRDDIDFSTDPLHRKSPDIEAVMFSFLPLMVDDKFYTITKISEAMEVER